jgi:hypothetical protein
MKKTDAVASVFFYNAPSYSEGFYVRIEQHRDDVALQEVDNCHAVVGGDEDFFGH